MESKIHAIDKAKELPLVMNLCRDIASIISCLNLKPDVAFLPYNMPEIFPKTGRGLTDYNCQSCI